MLAEVTRQVDRLDAPVARGELAHHAPIPLGAAVVHQHNLEQWRDRFETGDQPAIKFLDTFFAAEKRNHHGNMHAALRR